MLGRQKADYEAAKAVVRKVAGKWYVTVCYAVEAPVCGWR